MISYELAQKLKKAGFPQKPHTHYKIVNDCLDIRFRILSELIDACWDRFGQLVKNYDDWSAGGGKMEGVDEIAWEFEARGNTPEEAVAKLWLELNKTKQ